MNTIHASAVLVGRKAALIRGPAGSGKSRLAWQLVQAARQGLMPFARLVADDRVYVQAHAERLLARPPASLAGLIEIHGLGIRRVSHEPVAMIGLVVDLAAPDAERFPGAKARETEISGIRLPRLAVAAGIDPVSPVLAFLASATACD